MASPSKGAARRQQGSERGGAALQRAGVLECSTARAQGGEKGERERERSTVGLVSNSKFSIETRKILNTKVVQNSNSYNFPFRPNFV